jgi:tRNA 2-thiocytidine biosynthesis protein TtcA
LFEIADQLECSKIALGHTKDDIIETFFLNVCYAGEISTMNPKQGLFRNRFQVIRPLAYVDEAITKQWATEMQFPLFENPCPSAKVSKRTEIKKLLNRLYVSNSKIKGNIFRSLHHVKPEYLL